MTAVLVRKLLRDVRLALLVVAILLGAFQYLWANVTGRILGQLAPFFHMLGSLGGLTPSDIESVLFEGPGKIVRTLIGGEQINLNGAMDMLSIGFVHPLIQTILCIWAVGRAAGAISGELDRGTMELLMSQPMARSRVILSHLIVDGITIPLLCLSLWAGAALGAWAIMPIKVEKPDLKKRPTPGYLLQIGPLKMKFKALRDITAEPSEVENDETMKKRLEIRPREFSRALPSVGGLIFAVCGMTMFISSLGRSRWRVLGFAVFFILIQFLVNLVGQMWDVLSPFRPLTIFYYYQPQQAILDQGWCAHFSEWNGGEPLCAVPMLVVLYGVGIVGYGLAWWTFHRRDLPAPL